MSEPNAPLDYRNPQTPGERRTGRNFAVGVLFGIAGNGVPWAMGAAGVPGQLVFATVIALIAGAIVAALVVSLRKRNPGVAPGLLVSVGLSLLVYGGLCFYALQNI